MIVWSETTLAQRPPSVHRRYVTRARYLLTHAPYLRALEEAAARWDAYYPNFAVGKRGIPPDPPFPDKANLALPPALAQAVADWHEQESRGVDPVGDHPLASDIAFRWSRFVHQICNTWWPADIFPNWRQYGHPAERFVSGCLVWRPQLADPEWIESGGLVPHVLAFDATDPDSNPHVIWNRELLDGFLSRLAAAFDKEPIITSEHADKLLRDAAVAALDRLCDPSGPLFPWNKSDEDKRLLLPIYTGMTSEDLRSLEQSILDRSGMNLSEIARRLADKGWSKAAIAGHLGVDRRSVYRYLPP